MAIIRVEKTKNYTVMSNVHLRDTELSWKAKGILSTMLACKDDYKFTTIRLKEMSSDGMTSLRSGLDELEELGYLVRTRLMTRKGVFFDVEYTVYEHPVPVEENTSKRINERICEDVEEVPKKEEKQYKTSARQKENTAVNKVNKSKSKSRAANKRMDSPTSLNMRVDPATMSSTSLAGTTMEHPTSQNPNAVSPRLVEPQSVNQPLINTKDNKYLNSINTHSFLFPDETSSSAEVKEKKRYSEDPQEQLLLSIYALEDQEMAISIAERKLKERLGYEALVQDYPGEKPVIDAIISIMVTEVFTTRRKQMRIASDLRHLNIVRKRFLRLNCFHLQQIIKNLGKLESDPVNDKQYILACLYNAPDTMPLQTKTEYAEWVNTMNERSDAVESCGTDWETYQGSCVQ